MGPSLESAVAAIPGPAGWSNGYEEYLRLAKCLITLGISQEVAIEILTCAYYVALADYGC